MPRAQLRADLLRINLPFYWLAYRHLGRAFTVKTFIAVALVSGFAEATARLVQVVPAHPAVAAVLFGIVTGAGLLAIFRHRASLGGVGIAAFYLQERWAGARAGCNWPSTLCCSPAHWPCWPPTACCGRCWGPAS